ALERLATIDTVIFDKTGTLTSGRPELTVEGDTDNQALALASAIASHSHHPYSRALAALGDGRALPAFADLIEHAGAGLEARLGNSIYRLGRPDWAAAGEPQEVTVLLSKDGRRMAAFQLTDRLRSGAREAVAELKQSGLQLELLSGDKAARAGDVARALDLPFAAGARPEDKVAHIDELKRAGRRVLMVGDGLNDAPA